MSDAGSGEARCLECDTVIGAGQESVRTERGIFCVDCFARLRGQVQQVIRAQSEDIDFPRAVVGAVLGGIGGAALWWGVTVLTNVAFGLIAIVIGVGVGKGIVMLTGGKRAQSLQILAVVVAVASYALGTYLTNRTFILAYLHEQGKLLDLPLVPTSAGYFFDVVSAGFRAFDLVFLAIAVHQAWRIPAPIRLPG